MDLHEHFRCNKMARQSFVRMVGSKRKQEFVFWRNAWLLMSYQSWRALWR